MENSDTSIASFAEITRRIIAEDGFAEYLPTVLYPERKHIMVLEGVPSSVDLESVSLDWAKSNAIDDEDFLVAFKVSNTQFKIIRRTGFSFEAEIFTV
jgi:hypothetical protein